MSFIDLRTFIDYLDSRGELLRIKTSIDSNQEINIIQHKIAEYGNPALLFENVKNSPYRIISNLFGTKKRVNLVFNGSPRKLGNNLAKLLHILLSPSIKSIFRHRHDLISLMHARIKHVRNGPVQEFFSYKPNLKSIPVLTCWPGDGGPFFTLPIVHTIDPENGNSNLAIYRLQRFNHNTTGMHWQIEKGGGFHFHKASMKNQVMPVNVILGGPPSLIIAAIAPLPENFDERLLAAYIMKKPLETVLGITNNHRVPARAEFILEGTVTPGEFREEGPFGDHFGHYSSKSPYPIFRVKSIMARKDAIYPATVVGKPIQEDFYIGQALQEMSIPIIKTIKPGITDLWSYPETGFHPLAVMSVNERYPREALKHTFSILGEGQLSLTKVIITVSNGVNVRNIYDVSKTLWKYLDLREGFHLISPSSQDTLDFTGPELNTGSRLILLAIERGQEPLRYIEPDSVVYSKKIHNKIIDIVNLGPAFLIVKVKNNFCNVDSIKEALFNHRVAKKYLFHVLVSEDVDLNNKITILWGWFTRFDPIANLYPKNKFILNNKLIFEFPILIDARWKKGYPKPVEFDPSIEQKINRNWNKFVS